MRRTVPLVAEACLLAANAAAQTSPLGAEDSEIVYPAVITPTRLRQSVADVPGSVTVITADTLRRFGVISVPDALRLVPGMAVTRTVGPDYKISYHGTNILFPRRMNVLIDGVSVYSPAFSEVLWSQLPVAIEDIDRIEVTRGSNSASYGPNSMLAVVNIVTKHPKDVERGFGAVTFGSQSLAEGIARFGFSVGKTAVSLTAEHYQDGGYDFISNDPFGHDSRRMNRLNARSHTELSDTTSLEVQAALVRGTNEVPFGDSFQLSYPDKNIEDIYVGAQLTHQLSPTHELQLRSSSSRQRSRQRWETCLPTVALLPEMFTLWRANPAYADAIAGGMIPSGGSATDDALAAAAIQAIRALGPRALAPTCVTPNEDSAQTRDEIELQDTYVFSERLRSVAGFGIRRQRGESQTFLGGTQTSHLYWLFGNVEGHPAPWLTINAGGYFEHDSISPSTFSPRAAVNLRISPGQTLRFVVSKGTRSPDIFEQRANWTFTFTDLNPPLNGSTTARLYQSAQSAGNLISERIVSREVGYLLNLQRYGLLLDAKAFHDRLSDLISERTNLAGFGASNRGAVTLQGVEAQATIQWSPKRSAFLNYAYLQNRGATNPLERSQYSRHSGSFGLSQAFGAGWRGAIAYYGSSGDGLAESRFGRLDLLASKTGNAGDLQWSATFALRRLDNPVVSHASGPVDTIVSRYNDRLQMYVQFALRVP